ncbi:integrase, partial [Mycobacterium kansasii]
ERRFLPFAEIIEEVAKVTPISCLEIRTDDWRQPFVDYLKYNILPEDNVQRQQIKQRSGKFVICSEVLYRKSYNGMLLRCLDKQEAIQMLREAHSGECGAHQAGRNLCHRVHRMGYYWPTMFKDAIEYAKRCHECQIHGDVIHVPPEDLHQSVASWPFSAWGFDVIGPINPPSSKGKQYILAVTDYFSKWSEAIALRNVREKEVVDFIRHAIIYRHGIPKKIVTDNGTPFKNRGMEKMCQKFSIRHSFSTPYYPPANGLADAFNKMIIKILKKTITGNKRDWDEKLQEALWAYKPTHRTATRATPYSLVYGVEAVILIEIQLVSLRIVVHQFVVDDENVKINLKELDLLDEKRLAAQ